ncbi:CoxG family protein [Oceanobacillus saliphilus]|uniref:CoxG family protein n=1 Tax=Oceanobacillus saliphilus TaxID=2925834 RepID=UPI00201DD3F0|nr:SRPBCC family protein [Oceanobacillus saliphilus]
MAQSIHHMELDISINKIWNFISDMNNWAVLIPGYADHEILSSTESIWKLHGDIGIMNRTVNLKVNITEWMEPSNVRFNLSSLNKTCVGNGYFLATELSDQKTKITGCLNLTVKGMMGPMMNPLLKTVVPKIGKDLTEKVTAKIMEKEELRVTV